MLPGNPLQPGQGPLQGTGGQLRGTTAAGHGLRSDRSEGRETLQEALIQVALPTPQPGARPQGPWAPEGHGPWPLWAPAPIPQQLKRPALGSPGAKRPLRLPAAVPFLMEGLKVGAGLAIIGAVVAEFAAGSGGVRGLAWQILDAGNKLQTDRMIAALVVLAVMGVAVHAGLERLERAGLRWWRGR